MSEKSTVGFAEEWQTGAVLVIGSAIGGAVVVLLLAMVVSSVSPVVNLAGFLGGAVVTFLVLSYLLYGR